MCSLCKFRTFYEDEMAGHMDSRFHKEHFKYVGTKLPKQTADFLQEYVTSKTKKTEELRKNVENLDALIQHIYRDQDLTLEIAMEHFVRKVEAVHCAACDLFIPMQSGIIQKHLKTTEHNRNRRVSAGQAGASQPTLTPRTAESWALGKGSRTCRQRHGEPSTRTRVRAPSPPAGEASGVAKQGRRCLSPLSVSLCPIQWTKREQWIPSAGSQPQ